MDKIGKAAKVRELASAFAAFVFSAELITARQQVPGNNPGQDE